MMTSRRIGVGGLFVVAVVALALVTWVLDANAQSKQSKPAEDVALIGRVVDLHCYITGQMPSEDPVKCTTECLRKGVPAGLELEDGLIVLGQGTGGPMKALVPFAYQMVEVQGKLYEKGGVSYLDVSSIKAYSEEEADQDSEDGGDEEEGDEDDD